MAELHDRFLTEASVIVDYVEVGGLGHANSADVRNQEEVKYPRITALFLFFSALLGFFLFLFTLLFAFFTLILTFCWCYFM